jgi:hypothetical protein
VKQKEQDMETIVSSSSVREPWNKGGLVGQKAPFKLKEIWAVRVRLQIASRCRDLALFNLAIDSKLRVCDLVKLRVRDVCHGQAVASRAIVLQQKAQRPVQFEITEPTREAVGSIHLSTQQYARIVDSWVSQLGLDGASYGTHTQADKSHVDLSPYEEPPSRAVAARAHEVGKYAANSVLARAVDDGDGSLPTDRCPARSQ